MKTYNPSAPLIFLHVPKTGGMSLTQSLREWFPGKRLVPHYRNNVTGELPARHRFEGPICIRGHFNAFRGFGVDAYYPQADQFITFLRDPFERFLSQWFFLKERRAVNQPDFETWINQRAASQAARDNSFSLIWQFPKAPDIEAILQTMRTQFVFVGFTERFSESVRGLAGALGQPAPPPIHLNRTERAADFTSWRPFYKKHFADEYEIYHAALMHSDSLPRQSARQ